MKNKKKAVGIFIGMLLALQTVAGCGSEKYPSYFEKVLQNREEKGAAGILLDIDKKKGLPIAVSITSEDGYLYEITGFKLSEDKVLEDITVDLSEYRVEGHIWENDGIFYEEADDTVYMTFDLSTNGSNETSKGEEEIPYFILMQFQTAEPRNYQLTAYYAKRVEGYWFTDAYCIEDTLYENVGAASAVPVAINLKTKELYECTAEWEKAEEAAADFVAEYSRDGKNALLCYLTPAAKIDTVTIYVGQVKETMDTETLMSVYLAYQERELLGIMCINEETGEITMY